MASGRFVIAAFLLLSLLHLGSTLQCFECVEEIGGDGICRDGNNVKHASTSCDHSCIQQTMAPISFGGLESNALIARFCTDPSYCQLGTAFMDKIDLKTEACTSCNTDYCNSTSIAIPSFILVAVLAVKYYFL